MNWTKEQTAKALSLRAEGKTHQQIAEAFGCSESTVRSKLFRAGAAQDRAAVAPEPPTPAHEVAAHRLREKLSAADARTKRLVEELARKDDELSAYKALSRPPRPIEAPRKVGRTQRVGVPVMLCSDWHVEEPVDPAKVNGLNEYNLEIADACVSKLAEAYACMIDDSPRFDVRAGVVWLGGDLMSGTIHPELLEANELSPQQAQVWLLDRLERMLREIAARTKLERIVVACNSGNHGRATEKIRVSTREANSNEHVVYQTLARLMRDEPRVEFQIAAGEWLELDVLGYRMAFTHGDSFNYGGGVGGMSIPIRRGIARQFAGRGFHQYCMGHFHTRQDLGDVQINGSMIGYSAYSQRIHAAPEPRQQAWFMVDSRRGKCLSAPIWL